MPDPTPRDWFLPVKPDPTNEELWAWSAEWLGWTMGEPEYVPGAPGATMRLWKGPNGEYTGFTENSWHPTAEGSEHQAMMIAAKILGSLQLYRHTDGTWSVWVGAELRKLARDAFGRAILLAARRAMKGEK